MTMKTLLPALSLALSLAACPARADDAGKEARPLRALYITGGCCHDYDKQKKIIPEGVSSRAKVEWTVVQEGGSSTDHRISLYEKPGWAEGYDVIVHNECFSKVTDRDFIENVLAPHRGGCPPS